MIWLYFLDISIFLNYFFNKFHDMNWKSSENKVSWRAMTPNLCSASQPLRRNSPFHVMTLINLVLRCLLSIDGV